MNRPRFFPQRPYVRPHADLAFSRSHFVSDLPQMTSRMKSGALETFVRVLPVDASLGVRALPVVEAIVCFEIRPRGVCLSSSGVARCTRCICMCVYGYVMYILPGAIFLRPFGGVAEG